MGSAAVLVLAGIIADNVAFEAVLLYPTPVVSIEGFGTCVVPTDISDVLAVFLVTDLARFAVSFVAFLNTCSCIALCILQASGIRECK